MAAVTPHGEKGNLGYEEVEKLIKDYMTQVRNIMYVEKDASVNYLEKILNIAKESNYLCVFRNKAPNDSNIEVYNMTS